MKEHFFRIFTLTFICSLSFADDNDWEDTPKNMPPEKASPTCCHVPPPLLNHYYFGLAIGGSQPSVDDFISVGNGSNFPSPRNEDRLTTKTNTTGMIDVSLGELWARTSTWLPGYSLGLRYRYIANTNVGKQVVQFASPLFTNYKYHWEIGSQIATVQGKLDLFRYEAVMPYISAGVGVGFHSTSKFSETPRPGITPRVSPGFASNTTGNFTYNLGAGFDFILCPTWNAFIGYEYQSLGTVYSGYGVNAWGTQRLKVSGYRTNSVLLGVNYLF